MTTTGRAAAQAFAASPKDLLCVPTHGTECGGAGDCQRVSVEDLNVPHFVHVDFGKKMLGGTLASGEQQTTSIQNVQSLDETILFAGTVVLGFFGISLYALRLAGAVESLAYRLADPRFI